MKQAIQAGDRVKLTGKFLRSTGQYTGREAQSVWTVTDIVNGGRWAITDQQLEESYVNSTFSLEELSADPTLCYRRIAVGNLQKVGK